MSDKPPCGVIRFFEIWLAHFSCCKTVNRCTILYDKAYQFLTQDNKVCKILKTEMKETAEVLPKRRNTC